MGRLCPTGDAGELAAVAEVATGRESVADAVAIVEAALRLQPLLDKASRLRRAAQSAAAASPSAAPDGVTSIGVYTRPY